MNSIERFKKTMSFEKVDRLPVIEWAPFWNKTLEKWYSQGLPREFTEASKVRDYFELDQYLQGKIRVFSPDSPAPAFEGAGFIKNQDDYEEFKKYLYPEKAFDTELTKLWASLQKSGDAVIWFTLPGFFWHPRSLLGIEGHMMAFYDQPELILSINFDLVEFYLDKVDQFCSICPAAFMTFSEDMSYNNGPMLSKELFDRFLAPSYNKIVPKLKQSNIIPFVDSDGLVDDLIPWLIEVGIEGILPLERMAKVDVAKIRKMHPTFKMIGGFDKTIMKNGKEAMREEFERLLPVMKQGGFIPSVDHQTPPDVSIDTYWDYVELLKEYAEKAVKC